MVETLADLAVRDADTPTGGEGVGDDTANGNRTALRSAAPPGRTYDRERLRTDARKTGNFLAHRGVRTGRTLAVADDPVPEFVLSLLAAGLLGATVRVSGPGAVDARAVVAPTDVVAEYDLPTGGQRIGYGEAPADPGVAHFEEEMWSENPTFPPPSTTPETALLATGSRTFDHGTVLSAARSVVADLDLTPADAVAVRAPLATPGTVVAGVVAPLLAGATVLLPDPEDPRSVTGSVAVGRAVDGGRQEERTVEPTSVLD